MARSDALESGELTDTAFYILLSVLEAKHGYLIMKNIETLTDNQFTVGPASMYTTLKKLEKARLIVQSEDSTPQRKTYIATESGVALLEKAIEHRRQMVAHGEEVLSQRKEKKREYKMDTPATSSFDPAYKPE
ncbi:MULTISPECIES: PadR family transcriptional regulator [Gracilibacillus]|uniref:PadR family transcriptional regulator n=1 Tax=Gracilibacillus TaxID=74385 RepID=UPI0008261BC2|nr:MULTISPECIES: PadR family transcriptional regulator [Gracilibacillus]